MRPGSGVEAANGNDPGKTSGNMTTLRNEEAQPHPGLYGHVINEARMDENPTIR